MERNSPSYSDLMYVDDDSEIGSLGSMGASVRSTPTNYSIGSPINPSPVELDDNNAFIPIADDNMDVDYESDQDESQYVILNGRRVRLSQISQHPLYHTVSYNNEEGGLLRQIFPRGVDDIRGVVVENPDNTVDFYL